MIKNYTSTVSIAKSVQHIEERLMKHGAKQILKICENQKLIGIAFSVDVNGKEIPFKLPARIDRVEQQLYSFVKRPRPDTKNRIAEQAGRSAWKLLADWVDIQMSLIELDQVELVEVFMPYIYDDFNKQTFFEKMKNSGFTLLEDRRTK
jgi:hypothetical protein